MQKICALTVFLLIILPADALAKSWTQAILDVDARLQQLSAEHRYQLGNGLNFDPAKLSCGILARRFKIPDAYRYFETETDVWKTDVPDDLKPSLEMQFLSEWLHAAKQIAATAPDKRAAMWNYNCARIFGFREVSTRQQTFYEVDGPNLYIFGAVESGFFQRVKAALAENPTVGTVFLGSPGGSVVEAINTGLLIRSLQLDTGLYGDCLSACPLVFASGINRIIYRNSGRLGIHQVSVNGEAVNLNDPIYDLINRYLIKMGLPTEYPVNLMKSAPPSGMRYLEAEDSCRLKFATWTQGIQAESC